MRLVSVTQMIELEKQAVQTGLSYDQMMANAGKGLADWVHQHYSTSGKRCVTGLVGPGNNGGDTLIALTHLSKLGWNARAYLVKAREPQAEIMLDFDQSGGSAVAFSADINFSQLKDWLRDTDILLDGILGTGIKLPLRGEAKEVLLFINDTKTPAVTIAVDCPSGVDCDSGEASNVCIRADHTICMAAVKQGLLQFPAFQYTGELHVVDIGLPEDLPGWEEIRGEVITAERVNSFLPERPLDGHKGTFGTCLVIAGSVPYCGAVILTCEAAYRTGAGLVLAAVTQSVYNVVAGHVPETTWLILPDADGGISKDSAPVVIDYLKQKSVIVLGPGWGTGESVGQFFRDLLSQPKGKHFQHDSDERVGKHRSYSPPLVIDADALKLLVGFPDWSDKIPSGSVLTPHPGEMSVLTGETVEFIQENRLNMAVQYAREWGHSVVLKGACTVVADPGGDFAAIPLATPALATAGTGDVLAGMIGGLMAQGVRGYHSACAAAWLHARAGILAAESFGSDRGVMARDVLDNLRFVFNKKTGL
jgi:NAD(P)H-hydrate epimerase